MGHEWGTRWTAFWLNFDEISVFLLGTSTGYMIIITPHDIHTSILVSSRSSSRTSHTCPIRGKDMADNRHEEHIISWLTCVLCIHTTWLLRERITEKYSTIVHTKYPSSTSHNQFVTTCKFNTSIKNQLHCAHVEITRLTSNLSYVHFNKKLYHDQ